VAEFVDKSTRLINIFLTKAFSCTAFAGVRPRTVAAQ
jgi:hypothetical protein